MVALSELRSMIGAPGPSLWPVAELTVHNPTDPVKVAMLQLTPQDPPTMTPVSAAPLLSSSSTVAIAFDANPAASSGTAA